MESGAEIIFQAAFMDENLIGYADFLIKKNTPSIFGDYSYEVYDTKITRKPKPRHIYQITAYSFMVSKIQGIVPKNMYLIDGSDIHHKYKTKEFLEDEYYLQLDAGEKSDDEAKTSATGFMKKYYKYKYKYFKLKKELRI